MNFGRYYVNIINFNNIKVREGAASSNETIAMNVMSKQSFKEKHKMSILKNVKKRNKEHNLLLVFSLVVKTSVVLLKIVMIDFMKSS